MTDHPYIEKILVLSTGHMPEAEPDFGSIRVIKYEYGYIITSVNKEYIEVVEPCPSWIKPILNLCHYKHKVDMLMFDRDGNEESDLETYDW